MYQAPRGTVDILPEEQPYWDYIEQKAARVCRLYGYKRIETPVSPLLLEQVQEFQAIVSSWFDGLQQIAIDAPQRHQVSLPPQRGAGCSVSSYFVAPGR